MNIQHSTSNMENINIKNNNYNSNILIERQNKLFLNNATSEIKNLPSIPLMALEESLNKRECKVERVMEKCENTSTSGVVREQQVFRNDEELLKGTEIRFTNTILNNVEEVQTASASASPPPPQYKYIPCPFGGWHQNDIECTCPMCELGKYIIYVFRNQRQASKHIMIARPSPYFVQTNGLPPAVSELAVPRKLEICPMFKAFGFCPYSVGCYLPHCVQQSRDNFEYYNSNSCTNRTENKINKNEIENNNSQKYENDKYENNTYDVNSKRYNFNEDSVCTFSSSSDDNSLNNNNNTDNTNSSNSSLKSDEQPCNIYKQHISPIIPISSSAEEEFERLCRKAQLHLNTELWTCEVCGYDRIDEFCLGPVGERVYYRQCPRCLCMCYYPQITYLVYHIIQNAADDYWFCKHEVDRFRAALPDEFKIPFTFEAHRVANIIFSWSLLRPSDARDAVDVAYYYLPEMTSIVSMGSGSGYVEHIFNRVMNSNVQDNYDFHRIHPHQLSSFDNVHVSFYGERTIDIFAFDELALRRSYSVHVSHGGPLSLLSIDCRRAVLLLSWPPFGSAHEEQSSMGFEALEYYTEGGGTMLIYIGDVGSTGDWRFHELLYTHYKLVREYPVRREIPRWCPQDMGLVYAGSDTIGVYRRRANPVQTPPSWNCLM